MARRTEPETSDPRDRVTPEDLNVAPELLGLPLARPLRRLGAMAVDVLLLAAVSTYGNFWLLAGCVLFALVHLREPRVADSPARRGLTTVAAAALLLFGLQQAWVMRNVPHHHRHHERGITIRTDEDDDEETRSLLAAAQSVGLPISAAPAAAAMPASAASSPEARIAQLEAELAEARRPKPFDPKREVQQWADGVGLRLGWAIVYFTLVPAWWNGQTIGKRLFGLRVVELSGKPMTAMRAFKRYGGYAAGAATGFFGFLQVLWDPNRQAIQDKTAHTVVIDLRRLPPAEAALPATAPTEEKNG